MGVVGRGRREKDRQRERYKDVEETIVGIGNVRWRGEERGRALRSTGSFLQLDF